MFEGLVFQGTLRYVCTSKIIAQKGKINSTGKNHYHEGIATIGEVKMKFLIQRLSLLYCLTSGQIESLSLPTFSTSLIWQNLEKVHHFAFNLQRIELSHPVKFQSNFDAKS